MATAQTERCSCVFFEEATDGGASARACVRAGIRIGTDLSLVLLKEPQARLARIPFDHISIPRIEMARQAFQALRHALNSDSAAAAPPVQRLLPVTQFIGNTLGPAPEI